MKTAISPPQSIALEIERQKTIISKLVTAALVCGAILVAAFLVIPFCESLSTNKPTGVGQWLRVRLFLFAGTAFLFAYYCPVTVLAVLFAAGVDILRLWGSYSVTMVFLQGFSSVIIAMMNQLQMAALAVAPIGSS